MFDKNLSGQVEDAIFYRLIPYGNGNLQEYVANCMEIVQKWTKDYIWQKDKFNLHIVEHSQDVSELDEIQTYLPEPDRECLKPVGYAGKSHLFGYTRVGDYWEEVWFIIYLLCQISQELDVFVVIWDSDRTQTLLVEAAEFLPPELEEEMDVSPHRCFVHKGEFHLIPLIPRNPYELAEIPLKLHQLTDVEGIAIVSDEHIQTSQKGTKFSKHLHNRMERISPALHPEINHQYFCCYLPKTIAAYMTTYEKTLIPRILSVFYVRTPEDMNSSRRMKKFSIHEEKIFCRIRFTRCLFAQMYHQHFQAPKMYRNAGYLPKDELCDPEKLAVSFGIKLCAGIEMLYQRDPPDFLSRFPEMKEWVIPKSIEREKLESCNTSYNWMEMKETTSNLVLPEEIKESFARFMKLSSSIDGVSTNSDQHMSMKGLEDFFRESESAHEKKVESDPEFHEKGLQEYYDQMDSELASHKVGESFVKVPNTHEVDVNVNLVKNLVESLDSEKGAPGPGSALIGEAYRSE